MNWELEQARKIIATDADPDEHSPVDIERGRRLANARAIIRQHEELEEQRAAAERRRAARTAAVEAASPTVARLGAELTAAAEAVAVRRAQLAEAEAALSAAITAHDITVRAARSELIALGLVGGPTGADEQEADRVLVDGASWRPLRPRDLAGSAR